MQSANCFFLSLRCNPHVKQIFKEQQTEAGWLTRNQAIVTPQAQRGLGPKRNGIRPDLYPI
jgi:hypothetical protein